MLTPPVNAVRIVLNRGYSPLPRQLSVRIECLPFAQGLNDGEVALVLSYIRNMGNRTSLVTPNRSIKAAKASN